MRADSLSLSRQQYESIMNDIWQHHRFGGLSKSEKRPIRWIKYVHPTWDMRDGKCFLITFRGSATSVDGLTFDFRDEDRPMYDRITAWLNGEEVSERPQAIDSTAILRDGVPEAG